MSIADKLTIIANNMQGVYDKGFADGKEQGGGGDSYYDAFWDGLQQNGARRDYAEAFKGWTKAHNYWKPKYDIIMNGGSKVFYNFSSDIGLPELCKINGVTMDWSNVQTFGQTFSYAYIPDVGVIDTRGAKGLSSIFLYAKVDKAELIMKDDGSQTNLSGAFTGAITLTYLTIRGKIGDTINFKDSKNLNKESITSIINALLDTASGKTLSLSKTAVNNAFYKADVNLVTYPFTETTKTENGITFTDNGDGTITLNGTSTTNTEFIIGDVTIPKCDFVTVRGNVGGIGEFGTYDDFMFYFVDWGYNGELGETSEQVDAQPTKTAKYIIYSGKTFDNYILKPEIIVDEWDALVASKPNWTITLK